MLYLSIAGGGIMMRVGSIGGARRRYQVLRKRQSLMKITQSTPTLLQLISFS